MGVLKNLFIGLFIYALLRIVIGWFWLVSSIYLNSVSTNSNKATIFSIKGMITNLAFILSDPFINKTIYHHNIFYSYLITGFFLFILAILTRFQHSKAIKRSEENVYFEK